MARGGDEGSLGSHCAPRATEPRAPMPGEADTRRPAAGPAGELRPGDPDSPMVSVVLPPPPRVPRLEAPPASGGAFAQSVALAPAGDSLLVDRDAPTLSGPVPPLPDSQRAADTPPADTGSRRSHAAPTSRWPSAPSARYEILERIGAGGMGRVFKAKDLHLGRNVAIKIIRDDEPDLVERFVKEARAQARIDHENVCKVYEAGEIDGQPYIAMQLINGPSLKAVKRELTTPQKLQIMCKIAEGLHAAHRLGMIHRDIKPSNVMLQRKDDGSYHPYLMDFGLAREAGGHGCSLTEAGVGTPAYMAPEQITGDASRFDRRTDVYALGATLYELMTGKPPFAGQTSLEILMRVMHEDPLPPSAMNPQIPADLQTVIMKCLEKEPSLRYESARAFAEDLTRYLEGEPIRARPATLGYILRKKARKHRGLVVLAGLLLASALVLVVLWIRAGAAAERREALAAQLGQHVKEIELFLRYASALPPHDLDREKAVIRGRIQRILAAVEGGGSDSEGPGQYALGRGHLVLHDLEPARKHLEQALAAGYARPEVHYALGLALGGLYQQALDRAQRIENRPTREAERRAAEQMYLEAALGHLRGSEGTDVESKTYIEGLVALYEKRYEDAAARASAAAAESPWLYEAHKLEGDARLAAATLAGDRGQKEDARRDLDRAIAAYGRAADMARSDATVYEALAEAWIQRLVLDIWQGLPPRPAFDAALAACDAALKADPESGNAFSKRGRAHFHLGYHQLRRGEDPRPTLERAVESGREALRFSPEDAVTLDSIGIAYLLIAKYERMNGQSPVPSLELATISLDAANRIAPTFAWAWNDAGVVLKERALHEAERGADPRPLLDGAVERFERAAEHDPSYIGSYANTAFALTLRANHDLAFGRDPRPDARRAIESAERAERIDPKWPAAHNNKGWALLAVAQYEEAIGEEPTSSLDRMEQSFRASVNINAEEADTHHGLGAERHARARHLIRAGADPARVLEEARASLRRAIELDGREPESRLELARLEMTAARRAAALGQDPAPHLDAARAALERGIEIHPRHAPTFAALAELHALAAEHAEHAERAERRKSGAAADEAITAGLAAADRALALQHRMALAMAAKGNLHFLRARSLPPGAKSAKDAKASREDDARRAVEMLEQALATNPLLPARYKDRLAEARKLRS